MRRAPQNAKKGQQNNLKATGEPVVAKGALLQRENHVTAFFCLRYSLYNATPHYTVSHFTVIVHIAKFWQLIGAVPWYGSDLGYSYSLWLLGDVPVIHGVVLLPALQAFLLQDSFLSSYWLFLVEYQLIDDIVGCLLSSFSCFGCNSVPPMFGH